MSLFLLPRLKTVYESWRFLEQRTALKGANAQEAGGGVFVKGLLHAAGATREAATVSSGPT